MRINGFGKEFRLCSRKQINLVFEKGQKLYAFPFALRFLYTEQILGIQWVLSVPKRNFKRAHERNHIRRHMRESIRTQQQELNIILKENNLGLSIVLVFNIKEKITHLEMHEQVQKLFLKIKLKVQEELEKKRIS